MTRLRIGKDGFSLPIELVTSAQAILARKRSGKSRSDRSVVGSAVLGLRRRLWFSRRGLLIGSYPETFHRVELARQGGYSNAKSGGFAAPLARLIELGFVELVKNGVVRGSDMLFLKGKGRSR